MRAFTCRLYVPDGIDHADLLLDPCVFDPYFMHRANYLRDAGYGIGAGPKVDRLIMKVAYRRINALLRKKKTGGGYAPAYVPKKEGTALFHAAPRIIVHDLCDSIARGAWGRLTESRRDS